LIVIVHIFELTGYSAL